MSNINLDTEHLIIEKSKELFYQLGHFKATSQEIADYSGVQRTLVNYYFRSKDNLFKIVHGEIIQELHKGLHTIFVKEEIPFKQQVNDLIDLIFSFKKQYPFFDVYTIFEVNNVCNREMINQPKATEEMKLFLANIQRQMDKGVIKKSHPVNFVLDLFSLISYPMVLKGLYKYVFDLTDEAYDEILKERKTTIKNLIFNT